MCMEYKDVKDLIDTALKPVISDISEIKETTKTIPALVERLTSYKDIEKQVNEHNFILIGAKDKPGIIDDIKELKNHSKKVFNWTVKVAAFTGTIIGIIATLKAFNIF